VLLVNGIVPFMFSVCTIFYCVGIYKSVFLTHPHCPLGLRMSGAVPPLCRVPSRQGQLYIYLPLSLIIMTVRSLMVYWQYASLAAVCLQHPCNYLFFYIRGEQHIANPLLTGIVSVCAQQFSPVSTVSLRCFEVHRLSMYFIFSLTDNSLVLFCGLSLTIQCI
jgi:hypothetical protein